MRQRATARLLALLALLVLPGCTVRYAHSAPADDLLADNRTGIPVEGGITFLHGDVDYGRVDLGILGSYQTFDFFTDAALARIDFTGRILPRPTGTFQPFFGAGLGIHRLWATETTRRCGRRAICIDSEGGPQRQVETGINPHWTAGLEVFPSGRATGLVVGVTHEFAASAVDWDLSGFRFSAGFVYRPR